MASGQPDVHTAWSTLYASTYWDMRLGFAGAAIIAEVQSSIVLRDQTRELVVVGRQPHPDRNFVSYSQLDCPRRAAAARRSLVGRAALKSGMSKFGKSTTK